MTRTKDPVNDTKRIAQKRDMTIQGRAGRVEKQLAPLPAIIPGKVPVPILFPDGSKIEDFTIRELRDFAKCNHIDIKGLRKKADIVHAIKYQ